MAESSKQIKREDVDAQQKVAVRVQQYKTARTVGFKHAVTQVQFKEVNPGG